VTTGGGGWGDPLEREPDWVQRDVIEGKVSLEAAREDYGVVLREAEGIDPFVIDEAATAALRAKLKAARPSAPPIIDRGAGYEKMQRGEFKPWMRTG
jgi:N-methylhydantoinase B